MKRDRSTPARLKPEMAASPDRDGIGEVAPIEARKAAGQTIAKLVSKRTNQCHDREHPASSLGISAHAPDRDLP